MQKYFTKGYLYELPSGLTAHPSRCIIRDGTITWSDALRAKPDGDLHLPSEHCHEQHIIKTAHRLEELNIWSSVAGFDLHDCLLPYEWFNPEKEWLNDGISVYFKHTVLSNKLTYQKLIPHIKPHEELEVREDYLFFKRC